MTLFGLFLFLGAVLVLLLLGMLVLESFVKLRLAWRFRGIVENGCMYPECIAPDCPKNGE